MSNRSIKVLVVEDEEKIANVIKSLLESKNFTVILAETGKKAIELFDQDIFSLVLLDLMLPEVTGEDVCRYIRKKSRVPIIMITAKVDEADTLNGLGIGADDYITKPFSLKALYARIEAVLRRSEDDIYPLSHQCLSMDEKLMVDFEKKIVTKNKEEVKLTPNEFKILTTLMKNHNRVFSREELIITAFGEEFDGYDRAIDSHIKNLRQKIENDTKNPSYIKTIHGVGYKFGGE